MFIIFYLNTNNGVNIITMSKTYNPKNKKRATTHGFLLRKKTTNGKNILQRRRRKGRKLFTVKVS